MALRAQYVRVEGLEPPWIAPPDPKSGMSTNFTTPAFFIQSFISALKPFLSQFGSTVLKKGVQIYRYFVTKNEFFQKLGELVNVLSCCIEETRFCLKTKWMTSGN